MSQPTAATTTAAAGGPSPGPVGGYVGQKAFGFVPDPWRNAANEPNAQHLAESHYDHGDLWHHHHRRHHHTLHDHHYVEGANENLNLQGANVLATRVIPSDRPASEQLTMRPDILGRWAFESGAAQYGFGLNYLPEFGQPRPHSLELQRPLSLGGGFPAQAQALAPAPPTLPQLSAAATQPYYHTQVGQNVQTSYGGQPSAAFPTTQAFPAAQQVQQRTLSYEYPGSVQFNAAGPAFTVNRTEEGIPLTVSGPGGWRR